MAKKDKLLQQVTNPAGVFNLPPQPSIPEIAKQQQVQQDQQKMSKAKLPEPSPELKFNPDGSVKYRNQDLAKEEYSIYSQKKKELLDNLSNPNFAIETQSQKINDLLNQDRLDLLKKQEMNKLNFQTMQEQARIQAQQKLQEGLPQQKLDVPQSTPLKLFQNSVDALDVGKMLSAGGAGAAGGALVGGPIGAAVGGAAGAASAFFYGSSSDRRQIVQAGMARYSQATDQLDKLMNSANAQQYSPAQLKVYWDFQVQEIRRAQQEVDSAAVGLAGGKLSNNVKEATEIEVYLNNLPRLQREFDMAVAFPNKNNIKTIIKQNAQQ